MKSPANYRDQAAYCVRLAENAKNSTHRAALLQQAQTLLRMADQAARIEQIVEYEDRIGQPTGSRAPQINQPADR
jgi:hypothetical protein